MQGAGENHFRTILLRHSQGRRKGDVTQHMNVVGKKSSRVPGPSRNFFLFPHDARTNGWTPYHKISTNLRIVDRSRVQASGRTEPSSSLGYDDSEYLTSDFAEPTPSPQISMLVETESQYMKTGPSTLKLGGGLSYKDSKHIWSCRGILVDRLSECCFELAHT